MENEFHCGNCGVEFNQEEAARAGGCCPECGADLTEIAGEADKLEKNSGPARIAVVLAILLIIGALFFFLGPSEEVKSVEEIFAEYRKAAADTPMMIDQSTRLDRLIIEDKSVVFETTLVNVGSEDDQTDLFKRKLEPFLADKYCGDGSSRNAMENGVVFGHEISANDGKLLYSIDISIEDC